LFTSDKRCRLAGKAAIAYLAVSILSVLLNLGYAQFAHGVSSPSMSLLFLYSLLGGTLVFSLLWFFAPEAAYIPHSRLFFNLYNSGIAALMTGSLLKGVMDIAGTSTPYMIVYRLLGWLLVGISLTGFIGLHGARERHSSTSAKAYPDS